MKTRKEKIDFIYEKIARKELKFWCKLQVRKRISWWKLTFEKWFEFILVFSRENQNVVYVNEKFWYTLTFADSEFEDLKVIWLPVMIWNIIEYFYQDTKCNEFVSLWGDLKEPIENQGDECIDYIYNLLQEE